MCSMPFSSGTTVSTGASIAPERIVERGRLHRDEQEVDRLAQLGGRLGPHRLVLRAVSQGQSLGRDQCGRVRAGDADDPNACADEPDGEHSADGPGAEHTDCAGSRHGRSGHVPVSDMVTEV